MRIRAIDRSRQSKIVFADDAVRFHFARQDHPPGDALEQKLKNFDVPASLVQVAAPGIEPVLADQIAVRQRIGRVGQPLADLLGQRRNVLRVVEYFDPRGMLVRADAVQPF